MIALSMVLRSHTMSLGGVFMMLSCLVMRVFCHVDVLWNRYFDSLNPVQVMNHSSSHPLRPGSITPVPAKLPRAPVTIHKRPKAHASLAVDGADRVWLAWDESGANWGKGLGARRYLAWHHALRRPAATRGGAGERQVVAAGGRSDVGHARSVPAL